MNDTNPDAINCGGLIAGDSNEPVIVVDGRRYTENVIRRLRLERDHYREALHELTDGATYYVAEERAELRRLHEAATPGEWEVLGGTCVVVASPDRTRFEVIADTDDGDFAREDENALLIAAAYNALPRLLDAIDALELERHRLAVALEDIVLDEEVSVLSCPGIPECDARSDGGLHDERCAIGVAQRALGEPEGGE